MLSLFRIIKFCFQDIMRNVGLSYQTVLILVLLLLSVNTLVVINVFTNEAVRSIKDQIDVSLYFNYEANDEEINEVKSYVGGFPEVTEIIFLNRDEVLAKFKEQHKDNPEVLSALTELGENPLGPTMIVKTREPKDYEKVIKALNVPEYENIIEAKTFGDTQRAIDRIHVVTTQVERFAIGLSLLFALIAFLIILNTIRVAIYTQRIEISIKKLVGASNWFVRGPYVIESIFFTIASVLITAGFLWVAFRLLDPYTAVVFKKQNLLFNYYLENKYLLAGAQFGSVLFLTVVSSLLAMRRYLRV
ncbi:MAG: FtsX-like permease family protein [Candidatus Magasanikbacteria bacterium]|nr:FtsX-like permease family protein [Candidatus Magasanikbacteria bacterium]